MKKIIVTLWISLLILSISPTYAMDFSDMSNHWSGQYVNKLVQLGAIGGFPDGSFKPNAPMTRAQFIKVLVTALGEKVTPPQTGYWAEPYIDRAIAMGSVEPKEFSNYESFVTRGEMARMIVRSVSENRVDNPFDFVVKLKDYMKFSPADLYPIANAYGWGLITGYTDGTFGIDLTATRAEASTILARVIEKSFRKPIVAEKVMTVQQVAAHDLDLLPTGYITYKDIIYDVTGVGAWTTGFHSTFSIGGDIDRSTAVDHIASKLPDLKIIGKLLKTNFYMDLSAIEAKRLMASEKDLLIIDVSPLYAQGHLPGAVNLYLSELKDATRDLDHERPVLVYCHSDEASQAGADLLVEAGFMPVYRLAGNYKGWTTLGYPVEK